MTDDNIQEYKDKIAELEKQLEEANNKDTGFDEIKTKYENLIKEKDNKITELEQTVETNKKTIDETVTDLNKEVQEKLEQTEAYKELLATVEKLEKDAAETTVDTLIKQGKMVPAQRETALKLCLKDKDSFLDLYRDAKPIVDTHKTRKSVPTGTAERIANYFKN